MAEYIEREALLAEVDKAFKMYVEHGDILRLYADARCSVIEALAADVAPVVHGRWIDNCCYNTCSACGNSVHAWNDDGDLQEFSYCPNCGARMDGE